MARQILAGISVDLITFVFHDTIVVAFLNVDNIGYVDGHNAIVICEDTESREGVDNFGWLFDLETREMTPILQAVNRAELANGYTYNFGNFTYLLFSVQHPYQFDNTLPQDCDPQGTSPQCEEYSGTADWVVYYHWPYERTLANSESNKSNSAIATIVIVISIFVACCVFVICIQHQRNKSLEFQAFDDGDFDHYDA